MQALAYIMQLPGIAVVSVPISQWGISKYPRQSTIHLINGLVLQCLAFIQVLSSPCLSTGCSWSQANCILAACSCPVKCCSMALLAFNSVTIITKALPHEQAAMMCRW